MKKERVVEVLDYEKYSKEISSVRTDVFIKEQNIDKELEFDGEDKNCFHALIFARTGKECQLDEIPVATGRVMKDGHIGRVAVLKEFRKRGYGNLIMKTLEKITKEQNKSKEVFLGAQESAVGFYKKIGYSVIGEMFMEANIPHYNMKKTL